MNRGRACAAALPGMLPFLAAAAPKHFSTSPASGKYARATGLDDAGRYAVNSAGPDTPHEGASIGDGTTSEPPGSLGGIIARIRARNNAGQAVGVSSTGTGEYRSFLYADGELVDLNIRIDPAADLLLKSGDDINDRSQILAHSCDRTGVFCHGSMLLTPVPPVPEPATISMPLTGLALAAAYRLQPGRWRAR